MLNPYLTKESKLQTTSDGRLVLVTTKIPDDAMTLLKNKGIYLFSDENYIVVKKCNFCDGEKTESLPWLEKLNNLLGDSKVPGLLNIGFNGCGMSCHGAVMEDIGIVYFRGEFEVYVGGRHMGRYVRLPLHVHKNLDGSQMIETVLNVVSRYKNEGFKGEKFFKYIMRIEGPES
jgi:precorrin-3B C17-methyltransferase